MHRVLRAYLVVLVLLPALACGRGESRVPAPAPAASASTVADAPVATYDAATEAKRPRIVFLGDSLTAGLGLEREQSVPALVQQQLDRSGYRYEVVNAGVSGDTSAG